MCLVVHGKFGQTENHFIDCKIRPPQLENELHTRFTFKSFLDSDTQRERERARRESRASELEAHTTPDRTTAPNPRLHRSHHTPALVRSRRLKHCWDRTHDPHPCPISLFLDLPLPFPQLSITLSSFFSQFDQIFEFNECFVLIFVSFKFINLFRS